MLFFKTKRGQSVMNFLFSFFAAIVIGGALFKIEHWPAADIMIICGLVAEILVFLLMAFLVPAHEEYYWERFFPNITEHPDVEESRTGKFEMTPLALGGGGSHSGNPALDKLDDMLAKAEITPGNLARLSENFTKLNTTVSKIGEISDVVAATGDYTAKTKEATVALVSMKEAYANAAASVGHFNSASESTKDFHVQVQHLTKNLTSLNTIYELELQDTNNHLKAMNSFYGNLVKASQGMQGSVDEAQKVQTQITALSHNLTTLNQIYGNMINAMHGR
jgi:gliding motility-associated protein GldL